MLFLFLAALTGVEIAVSLTTTARGLKDLNAPHLDFEWNGHLGRRSVRQEALLRAQKRPYCILERAEERSRILAREGRHICPSCRNKDVVIVTPGELRHLNQILPELMQQLRQTTIDCKTCGG